jgi:IS30 family transposase
MHVNPETIYAHIYAHPRSEFRKLLVQSLRRGKSKSRPRGSKQSCYSSLKIAPEQIIGNRTADASSREVAGHWEGDLVIGATNQSCVGTLVERETGFVVLARMQCKSARRARWQRGSSENINGLLRQFLQKGEDLSTHSQAALDHIAWLLNTRPRKRVEPKRG